MRATSSDILMPSRPVPLPAVMTLTFAASIGSGVVWNGLAFVAKHEAFTETQTMLLYLAMGAVYVLGALGAGRILRGLAVVAAPRTVLAALLLASALVCAAPALVSGRWTLWLVGCSSSLLGSVLWPTVESFLTAGRHGSEMRRAIGWWNLSWTLATACALVGMAPWMDREPRMTIVWLGGINLLGVIPLMWFPPRPQAHRAELAAEHVSAEYPMLLRAGRMLLLLSYVFNAAMSPLLPFLLARFSIDAQWSTSTAATWMAARVVAMMVMWRIGFWHGRWGTLLLGGGSMALGFTAVILSGSLAGMLIGLVAFGAGLGVVYYAALYYAMSVGHAEVEAGGAHEALIGVGYAAGPAAGLLGLGMADAADAFGVKLWNGAGIVLVVLFITILAGARAWGAYRRARSARSLGRRDFRS